MYKVKIVHKGSVYSQLDTIISNNMGGYYIHKTNNESIGYIRANKNVVK